MEPIARSFTDNSWVFILLLSIVVLLGVSRIMFQKNYGSLGSLSLFQDNQENFLPFAILINLLLVILIGLVLYPFLNFPWNLTYWPTILNSFVLVLIWISVRYFVNTLLIYLLGIGEYYRDIIKAKVYFRFFAVFVLLIAVLLLYYSDFNQLIIFYISLGIIAITILLEYVFQLQKNGLNSLYGSYYFILYLCMLEILPVLYVINHWNG